MLFLRKIIFLKTYRPGAHTAILLATLLFSVNYWVAKGLMPGYFAPLQIIFFRVAGAAMLFLALSFSIRELRNVKIEKTDRIKIVMLALLGVAANQIFFFVGLNYSKPVDTAIINATNPVFVLLLGAIIFHEKITLMRMSGIILGLLGALLLVIFNGNTNQSIHFSTGNLLIVMNTLCYSLYLVYARPVFIKYNPIVVMKFIFIIGFLMILPVTIYSMLHFDASHVDAKGWWSLVYVIAGTTFLAYLFTTYGLRKLPPHVVAYYAYVQPVLVAAIGIVFFHKSLTYITVISTILVLAGIAMITAKTKINA